jgi:major vault protein
MPADPQNMRETDLVLPHGVFAHVLEINKGEVNVHTGPTNQTLSTQSMQPVKFDPSLGRFINVDKDKAIQNNIKAAKGQYVVLTNPSKTGQPKIGLSKLEPGDLKIGEVENMPGPQFFSLWPGQLAEVLDGHQLRTNQYLVVRIVDDEAAKANWKKTVMRTVEGDGLDVDPESLFTGRLIVIRGTNVKFYIPPTGVEVVPNGNGAVSNTRQQVDAFVRDAVTLESLEYCILLDEQGDKRYVQGPDVVFPEPTEKFVSDDQGKVKFQLYELTELVGIHIKVISDHSTPFDPDKPLEDTALPWGYDNPKIEELVKSRLVQIQPKDGDEKPAPGFQYLAGDELFITGRQQPLYMPNENHSIVKYDGRTRYHAVWCPKGQGRYIVNRLTGETRTVHGPQMILPDPRYEVFTRRILTPAECELLYPSNATVVRINQALAGLLNPPDEYDAGGVRSQALNVASMMSPAAAYRSGHLESSVISTRTKSAQTGSGMAGDVLNRGDKFSPPRELIADTRYDGALGINPYTGYAIQIVDSKGKRRTVLGPSTNILEYDENLQPLTLSTGTPKVSTRLLRTAYLNYTSNTVSDVISAITDDLVTVNIPIKFLVRFEGDTDKWFSISNFIQYMIDHIRAQVGTYVRGRKIEDFFSTAPTEIRDLILGKEDAEGIRPLKHFAENGMTIYDTYVGDLEITNDEVDNALRVARGEILTNSLNLEHHERLLRLTTQLEDTKQQIAAAEQGTKMHAVLLEGKLLEARDAKEMAIALRSIERRQTEQEAAQATLDRDKAMEDIRSAIQRAKDAVTNEREMKSQELALALLAAEAEAVVKRFAAIQPEFVAVLQQMVQTGLVKEIAPHLAPLALVRDESVVGVFRKITAGTGLEKLVDNLQSVGGSPARLGPPKTS